MGAKITIPNFTADPAWPNTWVLGSKTTMRTQVIDNRVVRVDKMNPGTAHIVLNAEVEDFPHPREKRGVPVVPGACYFLEVQSDDVTVRNVDIVIHEYNERNDRLNRLVVKRDTPYKYVTHSEASRIIVSLRLKGAGGFTINGIKVMAIDENGKLEAGIHPQVSGKPGGSAIEKMPTQPSPIKLEEVAVEMKQLQAIISMALEKIELIDNQLQKYREAETSTQENQFAGDIRTLINSQRQLEMQIRSRFPERKTDHPK